MGILQDADKAIDEARKEAKIKQAKKRPSSKKNNH